jgi:crotonobetainyl-CoA:carnitine CoA-transferase CaiB-like acyl-CoA transferase
MSTGPLKGTTVLDLTEGVPGAYCTRLFAGYGAEVVKVERLPLGDPARRRSPHLNGLPTNRSGVLFNYLHASKQSLLIDGAVTLEAGDLGALAEYSDVIAIDRPVVNAQGWELSLDELRGLHPRAVIISIPSVESSGRVGTLCLSELTLYAMSGLMSLVGGAGLPPIKAGGYQASFMAGAHAAALTMFALHAARNGERGTAIEVPALSSCAKFFAHMSDPDRPRDSVPNDVHRERQNSIAPCSDGYVAVTIYYYQLPQIAEMLGRPELASDPRFTTVTAFREHEMELREEIGDWLVYQTKEEIVNRAQQRRLLFTPVNTVGDLLESEHLLHRGFLKEIELFEGRQVLMTGLPFQLTAAPSAAPRLAPKLGEVNSRLIGRSTRQTEARKPSKSDHQAPAAKTNAENLPLSGIRILDLTHRLAGPTLTMLLGDWGADVLKIEWWRRMDAWRGMISIDDDTADDKSYNKAHGWMRLNRNKRSLTLNLKTPRGREIFLDLARQSDVVVDNFSAGVLERLGLGHDKLSEVNPRIIKISMPGFGASGPHSKYVSNGPTFEGYSGLASITGYSGGAPRNSVGIWPDVVAGVHGAAAVGMALVNRSRTGLGTEIDLAQSEVLINMIGDAVLEASVNGGVRSPTGNHDSVMAPHGVYRCKGEDRWIAIAVETDDEWSALCAVSGGAVLEKDELFSTAARRRKNYRELNSAVDKWTSSLDCWELALELQRRGVDAAAVASHDDFRDRDGMPSIDYQLPFENENLGSYPGPAARLNGRTPSVRLGPPELGEHTSEILSQLLGLGTGEVAELQAGDIV